MGDHHSENSPSSFARRIDCPGSREAESGRPDQTTVYAAEGTAAHEVGEGVLSKDGTKDRTNVSALIGTKTTTKNPDTGEFFVVTDEMAEAVDVYVDYCRALMAVSDVYVVEIKLPLPFIGPDESGKVDFGCLTHGGTLEAVDYKHGQGVAVDAIGNVQGLIYGLGLSRKYQDVDWKELKVTIVQPRAFHSQGVIRSWTITREEAEEYYMEFAHAAQLTYEPDAPRIPGKWCQFCKAKDDPCPARTKGVVEVIDVDIFDDEADWTPPNPDELTNEMLSAMILEGKLDLVEDWCASCRTIAHQRHESGSHIPNMKIVATRAYRHFKPGVDVEATLVENVSTDKFNACYKPKELKTLAQIEKTIGKPVFAEIFSTTDPDETLIHKVSSGTTLVAEDDARPSIKALGVDEFPDLTL